jgi:hypothetical protein
MYIQSCAQQPSAAWPRDNWRFPVESIFPESPPPLEFRVPRFQEFLNLEPRPQMIIKIAISNPLTESWQLGVKILDLQHQMGSLPT